MIVFFGKHEIIEQWRKILQGDMGYAFCQTYDELSHYPSKNTTIVYVQIHSLPSLRIAVKLKLKGYTICKWWAGTDCRYLHDANPAMKFLSKIIYRLCIYRNFSAAPWLSDRLEKCGLPPYYLHTSTPVFLLDETFNLNEICEKKTKPISEVLIYSNPDRHWIYNTDMMLKLANETPNIMFTFIGDTTVDVANIPNARSLGHISQDELFALYRTNPVLLRITSHDAHARMVIEAMYFGLQVITNWPAPHAIQCHNIEEIQRILQRSLGFNKSGYDYVRSELNLEKWKVRLLEAVK